MLTLLDEGNRVAFGTRAPASSGRVADLLSLARSIRQQTRGRGLRLRELDRRLVEAATLGGAQALGMASRTGRIGSLGPGSRADFAVFDARGRYPYSALLSGPPCLATVVGGTVVGSTVVGDTAVGGTAVGGTVIEHRPPRGTQPN
ncbi:amidohydrolase family protein [Nonomuraea sp. NEAU-A123]|nr:amidohydrolase family protein [Nonomuraea sp. NEAU-A123]